jgi:hypothetical protein
MVRTQMLNLQGLLEILAGVVPRMEKLLARILHFSFPFGGS